MQADVEVLAGYGLAGLRRHRILRLTKQAYDHSVKDLAVLLTTSLQTLALKQDSYFVMTRGAKHDMGPGISHKTQILQLYQRVSVHRNRAKDQPHRAIGLAIPTDFTQVATLHCQGFATDTID